MIKITCTNCQKPLSLDETKLPMRAVNFPCPVCKTQLTVDRSKLEGAAPAPESAAMQPMAAQSHAEEDHENEFGEKALVVGVDHPAVRQAAKLIGFLPIFQADAARAREYYLQEFPQAVFLVPQQITAPPLESVGPLIGVVPADRRKSFFILVADNLRTLDGNAAFLYGVNLVVSTKDLAQFPQIYRDARAAHDRFYASMNAVLREKQSM